ncbi:MAG: hypothetical protein EA424_04325 [Planctomycetaceae bacterium]|nr:MAG: hypothetical protein EA424_04325 [Planctomycetaceae bacterium]
MTVPEMGAQRRGTRVTFLDQTGAKSVEAIIADSVVVRRILPNIVTKMNLPVMGPDGQPMSYSLDHKEGSRRLREEQTLPEAHVRDGDHLIVYPEIVAGSGIRHSPRYRRLCSDQRALQQLKATSPVFDYAAYCSGTGQPPEAYLITFQGRGLYRPEGSSEVLVCEHHQVLVRLGADYPRQIPELVWKTPIYHPNISSNGIVCLGGYSTYWAPSLQLDQLCEMLWDMIRYRNYDVDSPYNREAAHWVRGQTTFTFPIDPRPLRLQELVPVSCVDRSISDDSPIRILDDTLEIVEAELILQPDDPVGSPEILYID